MKYIGRKKIRILTSTIDLIDYTLIDHNYSRASHGFPNFCTR